MFNVYCHKHGSEVLLSTSRIEALRHTGDGIDIIWRCWCGERGHRSGRARRASATFPAAS